MRTNRGTSISEILLVVGAIGIIASIAYSAVSMISSNTQETKLKSDVLTLNASVMCFLGMGGSLDGVEEPERVFKRLRSVTPAVITKRMPGVVGASIDPQLSFRRQNSAEAATSDPRVYWNSSSQRFELKESGPLGGIAEFFVDHSMEIADAEYVERSFSHLYASESTWVWDYQDEATPIAIFPTQIPTAGNGITPVDDSPVPPYEPDEPEVEVTEALLPPLFSVPSGTYTIRDYDIEVYLSNPNDETVSDIYYQGNFGNWEKYLPGTPIQVGPDTTIAAQAVARFPEYEDSNSVAEQYYASPVQLVNPNIIVSTGRFGLIWRDQSISVELENTNGNDPAEMVYRLNDGDWTPYEDLFFVHRDDYPEGVLIEARAVSTAPYYLDSEIESEQIYPPVLTLTINADIDTSVGDTDLYTHVDFLNHSNDALNWSGINASGSDGSGSWLSLESGTVSLSLSIQDVLTDTLSALELLLYGAPGLHVGVDLDIDLDVNGYVYNTGLDFEIDLFNGDSILDIPLAEVTMLNYIIASSALTLDEDKLEFSAGLLEMADNSFLDDAIEASEHSDEVGDAIYNSFDFSIF